MRKYIVYLLFVIFGLLLGYFIFGLSGNSGAGAETTSAESETQMWTCSMHPQIMQPEPGDCPICGMALTPADSDGDQLSPHEIRLSENAIALANIRTTKITGGSAEDGFLKLTGRIAENPQETSVQASYFTGRLERLNVSFEGETVRAGQLLATIYSPDLITAQQELLTAAGLKESQPELYRAVRNKLKLLKLSENQIDAIESSGEIQEYFPVHTTVSGTVSRKLVSSGEYVTQGQPLLEISNLNTVWAMFDAFENQIAGLKTGQKIKVTTRAFPGREFDAEVSFISPVLSTTSRTVAIRAGLANRDGLLKPGMFVEGKIETGAASGAEILTVPSSAVLWTGARSIVYVKTSPDQPVFELREVTLGRSLGDQYEILDGLKTGEEVVINGAFTVDSAAQLQGKTSMMSHGEDSHSHHHQIDLQFPENFEKDFYKVIQSYFSLTEAFVNSDPEAVRSASEKTLGLLETVSLSGLGKTEKSHLKTIRDMLKTIQNGESLENQRDHLIILSEEMVLVARNFKKIENQVYVAKCPMVADDTGAVWLTSKNEILNPYYGDAMLTCGEIIDTLKVKDQ